MAGAGLADPSLAALHPDRYPAIGGIEVLAEALAGLGLGLALALALAWVAGRLGARVLSPRQRAARALVAARALPPSERLLVQARILAAAGRPLPPAMLYAPPPELAADRQQAPDPADREPAGTAPPGSRAGAGRRGAARAGAVRDFEAEAWQALSAWEGRGA